MEWERRRRGGGDSVSPPALTAVGDRETVGHFQIVNVGRESEFRGAELNHPYPKGAVLLVGAPREQTPCGATRGRWLSIKTCLGSHREAHTRQDSSHTGKKRTFLFSLLAPPLPTPHSMWTPTDLNAGRAPQRAPPQHQQHGHGQTDHLLHVCSSTRRAVIFLRLSLRTLRSDTSWRHTVTLGRVGEEEGKKKINKKKKIKM